MGQAGRKRAERLFDINVVADQHLAIYSLFWKILRASLMSCLLITGSSGFVG